MEFSPKFEVTLGKAREKADETRMPLSAEHMLYALLQEPKSRQVITSLDASPDRILEKLDVYFLEHASEAEPPLPPDPSFDRILKDAAAYGEMIASTRVLKVIAETSDLFAASVLKGEGVSSDLTPQSPRIEPLSPAERAQIFQQLQEDTRKNLLRRRGGLDGGSPSGGV